MAQCSSNTGTVRVRPRAAVGRGLNSRGVAKALWRRAATKTRQGCVGSRKACLGRAGRGLFNAAALPVEAAVAGVLLGGKHAIRGAADAPAQAAEASPMMMACGMPVVAAAVGGTVGLIKGMAKGAKLGKDRFDARRKGLPAPAPGAGRGGGGGLGAPRPASN